MRRTLILAATCIPTLGVGLYVLWPHSRRAGPPDRPVGEAVEPALRAALPRASEPESPRAIPITGRIVGAALKPASGLEVVLGEEKALSGPDGSFRFPPLLRTARQPLLVRRSGSELARFEGVFAGGEPSGGSTEEPADGADGESGPPRPPPFVRWTINLGADGDPAAPAASAGAAPSSGFPAIARVEAALIEEWGAGGLARIKGTTPLPDGAHLHAALYFDGERVVASLEAGLARGGRFEVRIHFPEDFEIHSSAYDLRLTFGVQEEDPLDVERFAAARPDLPWDQADDLVSARAIYVGDPAGEREENLRIERYYTGVLDSVDRLRRILASWSRRAREISGGWDPALLEARARTRTAWFGDPLADGSGKLDLQAWRRFMDEGFRPEVMAILERHRARLAQKYGSAELVLEEALRRLLALSRIESVLVYQGLGLPAPREDFFLDAELPEGDQAILGQILDKELESLQRFRNLTGTAPAAAPGGAAEDHSSR